MIIPRCKTCEGKFKPKSRVSCVNCNASIHYDCAVYEDDDSHFMLCLDCYKNKKIEEGLVRDGIIVRVKGDDLCRAYIGKSFWEDNDNEKFTIGEELVDELECEIIDDSSCSSINPEPFESSDFVNYYGSPYIYEDCAYGYCREDLYNRGKVKGWQNKFICSECRRDLAYLEELDKLKKKYNVL